MKKIFTLLVAALAALSVNAQTRLTLGGQAENESWSWGWTQTFGAEADLAFTSQWGEFNLATTGVTEGATYKLVVAEANSKINFVIKNSTDDASTYTAINETEITGTIPAGATKIELQGTEAGQALKVLSFTINDEQTSYSTNWGVGMYGGKYTTSQWGELYLVGGVTTLDAQTITITANEAIPEGALQLKVYYKDKTEGYPEIPAGTTATIDIDAPVAAISIQAKDAYTIDLASVYTQAKASAGIRTIQSATVEDNANAPVYNLNGQRVSKSYKGVVIQNGKKYINK